MLLLLGLETAVTSESTGGIAIVNEVIERAVLAFPVASVTLTVQLEYVPSASVLKVIVVLLSSPTAEVLLLSQLPP